jgi:Membrane protein involved in colicin uptake
MAIQMRRGMKKDFDPSKLLPGEWAVTVDGESKNQIIWMCFAAGVVKRMGTFEDFRQQIEEATGEIKMEYLEEFNALLEQMQQAASEVSENTKAVIRIRDDVVGTYLPQMLGYVESVLEKEESCRNCADLAGIKAVEAAKSETNAKESEKASKISEDAARQYSEVAGECASTSEGFANIAEEKSWSASQSADEAAESVSVSSMKADEAAESESRANSAAIDAMRYANYSSLNVEHAERKAAESEDYALQAQSYALGIGNIRPNESQDNAKYYYEQAKTISESFAGALRPMGTVAFANLPALIMAVEGDMYNISDEFITNADFKEGAGLIVPAGSNIYKTADGKWDILAGTPVTGVKGNSESNYRKGNVNITPSNIGAPSNEYIAEHFVPDYVSRSRGGTISSKGWYRIAQAKGGEYGASCVISIKRSYNSPAPEYQKVQLMDSYRSNKIIPIVSFTGNDGRHLFTKIRKVYDAVNSIAYIEIYQAMDTSPNVVLVSITDALNVYIGKWKAIEPVETQEIVEGIKVLASLDLPANFDSDYLAKKDGSNVSGTWSNLISGKALKDGDGNVIKDSYLARKKVETGTFDNLTEPGLYQISGLLGGRPTNTISQCALLVMPSIRQVVFEYEGYGIYTRNFYGGTWGAWKQIYVEGNISSLAIKKELVDIIYPIGSIYMSVTSTSPATLFGGTWVRWGNGRIPVGVDASQTEFNTVEKTGGSKYLQNHKHATQDSNYGFTTYKSGGSIARLNVQTVSPGTKMSFTADAGTKDIDYSKETASAGSGNSENLQPYITCYMWKRTA